MLLFFLLHTGTHALFFLHCSHDLRSGHDRGVLRGRRLLRHRRRLRGPPPVVRPGAVPGHHGEGRQHLVPRVLHERLPAGLRLPKVQVRVVEGLPVADGGGGRGREVPPLREEGRRGLASRVLLPLREPWRARGGGGGGGGGGRLVVRVGRGGLPHAAMHLGGGAGGAVVGRVGRGGRGGGGRGGAVLHEQRLAPLVLLEVERDRALLLPRGVGGGGGGGGGGRRRVLLVLALFVQLVQRFSEKEEKSYNWSCQIAANPSIWALNRIWQLFGLLVQ